jgi:hypothetical protein
MKMNKDSLVKPKCRESFFSLQHIDIDEEASIAHQPEEQEVKAPQD